MLDSAMLNNKYLIIAVVIGAIAALGYVCYIKYLEYDTRVKRTENEVLRIRNVLYNSSNRPSHLSGSGETSDEEYDDEEYDGEDEEEEDEDEDEEDEDESGGKYKQEVGTNGLLNMLGGGMFDQLPHLMSQFAQQTKELSKPQPVVVEETADDDDDNNGDEYNNIETFDVEEEEDDDEQEVEEEEQEQEDTVGVKYATCNIVMKSGKRKGESCGRVLDTNGQCPLSYHNNNKSE